MKTKFTLAAALLFVMASFQQALSQTPVYVGIKGGISIPNLTAASSDQNVWDEGYSSRIGPNVGILAEFQFSKLFSIQPEIDFIGEGGKRDGIQPFSIPDQYVAMFQQAFHTNQDYVFANYNNVSRINYLQIPIMAKFNFPLTHNKKLKFFVQAGPDVAFMVGAKQIVKSNNLQVYLDSKGQEQIPQALVAQAFGTTIDTTIDAKDQLYKVNVGIQGGIGFSLECGRGKFFVEGGGNYGFINIQKGDEHGKNNIGAGTVAVGYAIRL